MCLVILPSSVCSEFVLSDLYLTAFSIHNKADSLDSASFQDFPALVLLVGVASLSHNLLESYTSFSGCTNGKACTDHRKHSSCYFFLLRRASPEKCTSHYLSTVNPRQKMKNKACYISRSAIIGQQKVYEYGALQNNAI